MVTITGTITDDFGASAPWSATATQGSSYPDGSANAPSGVSPTGLSTSTIAFGSTTFANALSGYVVRPPWQVAGVDYRVGIHAGVVLKPPSAISGPGLSYNGTNAVTVSGSGAVLDGFDLSGNDLNVTSATNFLIQNCKLSINSSGRGLYHANGNCSGTVQYCEFYGNYKSDTTGFGAIFYHDAVGSITVQYCYLERAYADVFNILGGAGVTSPAIIKYNVIHSSAAGGHPDWLACGGSATYGTLTSDFNLWLNIALHSDVAGAWGAANTQPAQGTQGIGWDGYNSASNNGPISVSNNTVIAKAGASMNLLVGEITVSTSGAYSYTIANNYLDPSGTTAGIQHGGAAQIITGNVNMVTGGSAN